MKVLLTSTSFQDSPGDHQKVLNNQGYHVDSLRGPLKSSELIPIISKYDGIICGDDEINEDVIKLGSKGKLKIISKYGIGLDKIDLISAEKYGIPVTNCIGANQIAVAEHVFGLILSYYKNICLEYNITKKGKWDRLIGNEIYGKTIGIIGLGRIGKEVSIRAKSFGLNVIAYDKIIDKEFIKDNQIQVVNNINDICQISDILTLHINLSKDSKYIISKSLIEKYFKKELILINTSRGELVDIDAVMWGLEEKIIGAYLTDVLDLEPMPDDYPLSKFDNVIITPHIGSRTYESIQRQGIIAVNNLINYISK